MPCPPLATPMLQSYLSNCTYFDDIPGFISSTKLVANEVPHVSILRPILFLIFINDLTNALKTLPQLFAHDSLPVF